MKTFSKYIATIIISIIISFNLFNTFAIQTFAASEALPGGNCLESDEKRDMVIVIIEEPLTLIDEKKTDDKTGNTYETRTCYREEIIDSKGRRSNVLNKTCSNSSDLKIDCDPVQVILTSAGGLSLLYGYIGYLYRWAASFVGLVAVAVIIGSSAQISLSGGNSDATKSAKDRIIKSLSGLAILFLSSLILYTINPSFFTL